MTVVARLLNRWRGAPARNALSPSHWRPEALPAGTILGQVRIERAIARGASGALYSGIDEATGQAVAVKLLSLPHTGNGSRAHDDARARFLHDAEQARHLQHPGIVRIEGGGSVGGLTYVVMELLPGADLSRYTHASRLLPEPLVLDIAARLAEALAYAHRAGMVHRDVKPANVMYDPATDTLKLTDFGLARSVDAEATRSGVLLGSPAYMAPELLGGARADARSDLYALGILLFELLTGRLPFEGDSMGALLRAMATQTPRTVQELRPDLPTAQSAALDALLQPVRARAPLERLGDGDAWARALRAGAYPRNR